jgi:UDP-GlcNAc3NAcA epimerase
MKIITIIGARPQFVKAAMVSRAIAEHNQHAGREEIKETIIHTGQHYDINMSEIFFRELNIPAPEVNLNIGSGSHGNTTGRMLAAIEKELMHRRPDRVLVYGDTNSTLAGALAAAKLHIPVVHVEAGLRSFNRCMPEEINRVLTDHVSDLLFCPTDTAVSNLAKESITSGVFHVGDVMFDAALVFGELAQKRSNILEQLSISSRSYYLATVHRAENTDAPERLKSIFSAFEQIASQQCPIILPLHPRTKVRLLDTNLAEEKEALISFKNPYIQTVPPVSFLDMVMLEKNAKRVLTDSGGVQKEAYFHQVPCITLRDETEWVETVEVGANQLAGADCRKIVAAVRASLNDTCNNGETWPELYGNGKSSVQILQTMLSSYLLQMSG